MKDSQEFEKLIKQEINEDVATLSQIYLPNGKEGIYVYLKREELLHPTISGNKWRKLKYNLIEANNLGIDTLLTFGGAYSNHIHATAHAGKIFGLNTIGIIRGEEHLPLNPTLTDAQKCGMQIHYISRSEYRKKKNDDFVEDLRKKFGKFYLVPEGGTNSLAVKGCTEILDDISIEFDYILSACGTGGTISGLICGLKGIKQVIGVPVLKGANFLYDDISEHVKSYSGNNFSNWKLNLDFHFGGYAKITKELIEFIDAFELVNKIKLDPVYTGKLLFAVNCMLGNCEFRQGSSIIVLHTGGLQGVTGMKNRIDKLLS